MAKGNSNMGRPKTEEYRKRTMRFSRVEDTLAPVIESLKNPEEKKMLLKALDALKA